MIWAHGDTHDDHDRGTPNRMRWRMRVLRRADKVVSLRRRPSPICQPAGVIGFCQIRR
ncbi:hypothetical protein FRAAL3641 [Frankia alni ACN14a]|uniref:Uncharacterized protein n=1 Tax=Frankia alni (strain DSM 45986 / CECT 9034 / ACN14a) TaxID=326424 RepID=Q0RJM8_FRAAA|nr:hypothetical protein FRAAL3641 [Frankia alni ACN14a]